MGPKDLAAALSALIPAKRPTLIWGPPGVGKSSIVQQICDDVQLPLIDVRAVLLDPVDVRGFPYLNGSDDNRRMKWAPPCFFPRNENWHGVIFIDELPQAPPLVQAALLQLILDRRVGEYELPEGAALIAAGNRTEDRAGTHRLISPLLNRFVHLDLEVSAEDWNTWALENEIAGDVRAYILYQPSRLMMFDAKDNPRAFPTPRSWSFVSDLVNNPATPAGLLHSLVTGCVGEGAAAEFMGFRKIYKELPDVDGILKDPEGAVVPKDTAVLYATCGALTDRARTLQGKTTKLTALVKYALRMAPEYSAHLMRDAAAVCAEVITIPAAGTWFKQNGALIGYGDK